MKKQALVAIIMGSDSDWPIMKAAAQMLADLDIAYTAQVVSAHRTPDLMFSFAETAAKKGYQVIIAGAGGAAHLPGMVAAKTTLPVLGVPVPSKHLHRSPVATFAIGEAGAANAGLFAASILANQDAALAQKLADFRAKQSDKVQLMVLSDQPQ
jgi:5-(carboxyamino)imidazole ribonucleotide mutase